MKYVRVRIMHFKAYNIYDILEENLLLRQLHQLLTESLFVMNILNQIKRQFKIKVVHIYSL